jgi:hypothetical protein
MICSAEKVVGHNPWAEALMCAPKGLQNLSPGFQPSDRPPGAARPGGGRQIERPIKTEAGSDGPIVTRPNCVL